MARRMLIDASHPEETRVVVVDGTRLEEFDFETASRKPLKGNIYLAKVIRIEPSLQAAFVEYGGNRHGFLAFSEIHPDYYQIPVADRERLIAEQQRMHAEQDEYPEPRRRGRVDRTDIEEARADLRGQEGRGEPVEETAEAVAGDAVAEASAVAEDAEAHANVAASTAADASFADHAGADQSAAEAATTYQPVESASASAQPAVIERDQIAGPGMTEAADATIAIPEASEAPTPIEIPEALTDTSLDAAAAEPVAELPTDPTEAPQPEVSVETLGGDDTGEERETRERRRRYPSVRQYKIQEVIKRRQILLVQVVKEERGNKGAALTTYLSLAGRYCVLMPNAGRGGGISRKISNPADRKRMKDMLSQLEVPQGMGVILRTAGLERSNIDIKRDYEYLSRLWDSIRDLTMRSTAPALIYEEGDLIKRSLRDVYDTDIAQVLVEGEAGFTAASEFMRQLVPHQAAKVELYNEPIPLFHRYQVEAQFDAMHSPTVQLRSGGYIVINPTEALVAIDVNSGRSTKERNIEETAVRTNVEAAEEVARQVRLRDLAGLIVIDFIDMEETRHQRQVEHKVKDAMRTDRARIQIGRISAFGLLEMSRQRLRPSLLEHSTEICPHCAGTGRIRSIESASLHALRAIEEEGVHRRASEIAVSVPPNVALYLLNQKRQTLSEIEKRYGFTVLIEADEEMHAADCEIERVRSRRDGEDHRPTRELAGASYDEVGRGGGEPRGEIQGDDARPIDDEADIEGAPEGDAAPRGPRPEGEGEGPDGGRRRRRRRRRRGGRSDEEGRGPEEGRGERPYAAEGGEPRPESRHKPRSEPGEIRAERQPDEQDDAEGGEPAEGGREFAGEAGGERGADDRGPDGRRRRRGRRGGRRRRGGEGDGAPRERQEGDRQPSHDNHAHEGNGEAPPPSAPMEHMPVESMSGGHMPVERAPYDPAPPVPAPPVNVEAATPPPPPAPPVYVSAPQPPPIVEPPPAPAIPATSDAPPEKPKRGWWRR